MNASNQNEQTNIVRYKARGAGTKSHRSDQYARLLISVGQPYHEGAKLAAAIKWAKDNFDHQVIFLADTLQRYNLMLGGMDADVARQEALMAGDFWLKRHAELIEGIEVFRWDQAVNHPNYAVERDKMNYLYREEKIVEQEVKKAVKEVALRRMIPVYDIESFMAVSIEYLLEEAAGRAVENEIYPGVSAYPASIPDMWSIFSELPQDLVPKGLLNDHLITLELKRAY